jgi:hypothetical protein
MKKLTLEKTNYHKFFLIFLLVTITSIIGTACVPPLGQRDPCSDKVSIASNNSISLLNHIFTRLSSFAKVGDEVTVSLITRKNIEILTSTISGVPVEMTKDINDEYGCTWKASRTMTKLDTEGKVEFTITIKPLESESVKFNFAEYDVSDDGQIIAVTSRSAETSVTFDKTPPIITGEITTPQSAKADYANKDGGWPIGEIGIADSGNIYDWYVTDVTVHFEATDNLSGIKQIKVPSTDMPGIDFTLTEGSGDCDGDDCMSVDVTLSTDVFNQTITGTAIDWAGNTSEPFEIPGISINRIVILVVDGLSASGDIHEAVVAALNNAGILFPCINYRLASCLSLFESKESLWVYSVDIDSVVQDMGLDPSDEEDRANLRLLLVGKSLGGANMYKFLELFSGELNDFKKVALVLVDAHEPGEPGDEGHTGDCDDYDFVCFSDCEYCLTWFNTYNDDFNYASQQESDDSKLRVFNIYQRNDNIKGYSFPNAYSNNNLSNIDLNGEASHWNIANCEETRILIQDAIEYLKK